MTIGKRKRFEIFKRDGFVCQYCGMRPPDVVLEIDHIDPRAEGGSDDEINLITACYDCNRGKSAKRLGEIRPRPDADLAYLQIQQELAEAKRYLEATRVREELYQEVKQTLAELWCDRFEVEDVPIDSQWRNWLRHFSPEEIESAITITAIRMGSRWTRYSQLIKYVSGVLWRGKEERYAETDS